MFKIPPRPHTPIQIGKRIQPPLQMLAPRARTPTRWEELNLDNEQPYKPVLWSDLKLSEPPTCEKIRISDLIYDNMDSASERNITCKNFIVDVSSMIGNTSTWPKKEESAKSKFIGIFKRLFIFNDAPLYIGNFEKVIFVTKCAQSSPSNPIAKDKLNVYRGHAGNEALFKVLHELTGADKYFNTDEAEPINIIEFFVTKARMVLEDFEDFENDVDELKRTSDKSCFELASEYLKNHRLSIFEDGITYEQFTMQFSKSKDKHNSKLCRIEWLAQARLDLHNELTYNGLKKGFRNHDKKQADGSIPGYYYRQNAFKWIYEYVQSIKDDYPELVSKISLQPSSASLDSNRIIESIVSNSNEPENYAIFSRGVDMFAYCPQSIHIQKHKNINGEKLWERIYSQLGIPMKTLPPKVLLLFSTHCDLTKAIRTKRIVPTLENYTPSQKYSVLDYINDTYIHVSGSLNLASILSMLHQNPNVSEAFKFAARFMMNRYHAPEIKSIEEDEEKIQRIIKTLPHFS